ncbi:hypothetical protein ACET9V_21025 [Aeromonas caviae]|uniref:hypothetical protein n=1 Tax=Aeromonas caviae TaxID=648 RepID=UPI0038D1621D
MTMITKKSIRDSFRSTKQAKAAEIAALQEQIAAVRAELNAIRAEEKAQLATVPTKVKAEIKTASKLHPLADLLVIPAIGTLPALPAEEAVQHPHYTRIERFWPKAVTNSTRWTHEEAEKCTAFEEAIEAAPDMPLTNASQVLQELLHIPADHEHQFRFNVNTISGPM